MDEDDEEEDEVVVDGELGLCIEGSVMEGMEVAGGDAILLSLAEQRFFSPARYWLS